MTLRLPPAPLANSKISNPVDALDYEIAQEMAGALGRLGRALERSLQMLADFDAASLSGAPPSPQAQAQRRRLVADAARALWQFVVQRECCGLRDSRQVMRDYAVPPDVRDRMGVFP